MWREHRWRQGSQPTGAEIILASFYILLSKFSVGRQKNSSVCHAFLGFSPQIAMNRAHSPLKGDILMKQTALGLFYLSIPLL